MKLELEIYTPSEAEAITEVKQATVRNWRRAGHLPRQSGHARYNFADILVMFVMGMLVSRGTTPEAAKEFSGHAARAIFQSAIWSAKAFSEEVRAEAVHELDEIPEAEVLRFREQFGDEFDIGTIEWVRSQEIMIKAAEQLAGISGMKHPNWLVIWNSSTTMKTLKKDFSEISSMMERMCRGPLCSFASVLWRRWSLTGFLALRSAWPEVPVHDRKSLYLIRSAGTLSRAPHADSERA